MWIKSENKACWGVLIKLRNVLTFLQLFANVIKLAELLIKVTKTPRLEMVSHLDF